MKIASILIGALLILLSAYGWANAVPVPDERGLLVYSPTVWIPAGFGGVLLLCGLLSFAESLNKLAMHFAAMVGLLGFLAGVGRIVQVAQKGPIDFKQLSVQSCIAMAVLCFVFVGLCVNSFIQARKARVGEQAAGV